MDLSPDAPNSVAAIFARAERVFERRVDQLLQLKRVKARAAGTTFNARKAKRDARTVAGREKLDALVRRLADLAMVQERALGEKQARGAATTLDAAANAVVGFAALAAMQSASNAESTEDLTEFEQTEYENREFEGRDCADCEGERRCEEVEVGKDMLDTSSCSDDCSVGGCLSNLKDMRDALETDSSMGLSPKAKDRHIFPATESVVNFVLECDDDNAGFDVTQRYNHDLYTMHQPVEGYDCGGVTPPVCPNEWVPHSYGLQSAGML